MGKHMAVRIAVCDDDRIFLQLVDVQVNRYFKRLGVPVTLDLFSSGEDFWQRFGEDPYDIVILDIVMPLQTGIELSRRIYQQDKHCVIAFLTASPEYALEGYGVNAVGYLLKPASQKQMDDLLAKCIERYRENQPASIVFKAGGVTHKVDADRIVYCESRNKQVLIHCLDEDLIFSGKLSDVLDRLPPGFVQTHKSYIANLLHITGLGRDEMIAANGVRIPISRQYYKDATNSYHAYLSRKE